MATMSTRVVALVSGILLVIGSFMTWVTVDIGFAQFSTVGTESVDGKVTAAAGAIIGLVALLVGLRGRLGMLVTALGLGAATVAAVVLANEYLDVRQRMAQTDASEATATIGLGVWITAVGALVAFGVLTAALMRARRHAAEAAPA